MAAPPPAAPQVVERPHAVPRENVSTEIWNLPNSLTLLRIFLVPFLVVVLLTKFTGREFVGLAIFLVAAITDFFDGWIARRQRKLTRLGTLLDPIADKLLMSAAFISLVEMDPIHVPAWMVVIIIGREFAVSGLRAIAAQQGVQVTSFSLANDGALAVTRSGFRHPADVFVGAPGAELSSLTIAIEQGGTRTGVYSHADRSGAEVRQDGADRVRVTREVGRQAVPSLQSGPARIVVTAARPVL